MTKGNLLSCLTDCAYISDYPPEDSIPARPVSRLQLDQRQRRLLQQRQSARERGQREAYSGANMYESENESVNESVGRHSGQGPQGRGVRRQGGERMYLEDEDGDEDRDEEDTAHISRNPPQRPRHRAVENELHEYSHEEDDDDNRDGNGHESENYSSRDHAEELLFQRRQSAHSQLPRRQRPVASRFAPEYDAEIRGGQGRVRGGARDGGVRRRQGGSGDAPPRYEDHVFDRVVDDEDDDGA